jgi:hypothetical protein
MKKAREWISDSDDAKLIVSGTDNRVFRDKIDSSEKAVVGELINSAHDTDVRIALRATNELERRIGTSPNYVLPHLKKLVGSKVLGVRGMALAMLLEASDYSRLEEAIQYFDMPDDIRKVSHAKNSIAAELEQISDPKIVPLFNKLLITAKDARLRRAVANSLRRIKDKSSVPYLVKGLDDEDQDVRHRCVMGLAKIDGKYRAGWAPSIPLFEANEEQCLNKWKHWWEENKDSFGLQEELKLTIESDKQSYRVGDEIRLCLHFENKSDNPITAAIGRRHFSHLEVYNNNDELKKGVLYDIKGVPLGFLENDYQEIKPKEKKEITILARIEKFSNRKLIGPSINYTGFAIVSKNIGFLFEKLGLFHLRLRYEPQFPRFKGEAIHSAYHKVEDVWEKPLVSNTIEVKVVY